MTGAESIARERARQVEEKGYSVKHDQEHPVAAFTEAAVAYLVPDGPLRTSFGWTIKRRSYRRITREDLVRAGALIAAAIDRMDAVARTWDR